MGVCQTHQFPKWPLKAGTQLYDINTFINRMVPKLYHMSNTSSSWMFLLCGLKQLWTSQVTLQELRLHSGLRWACPCQRLSPEVKHNECFHPRILTKCFFVVGPCSSLLQNWMKIRSVGFFSWQTDQLTKPNTQRPRWWEWKQHRINTCFVMTIVLK